MWVPRLCHAVSYDPWEVAELGVHPGGSSEGEKRWRSYMNRGADVTSGSQPHRNYLRIVTDIICMGESFGENGSVLLDVHMAGKVRQLCVATGLGTGQ